MSHVLFRRTSGRHLPFPGMRGRVIRSGGSTTSTADATEYDPERGGFAVGEETGTVAKVRPGRKLGAHHAAQRRVASHHSGYVGVWKDDKGVSHYDPVEVVDDLDTAVARGRERKQIAVWDFKNKREVTL